jgi:hypothetical protein
MTFLTRPRHFLTFLIVICFFPALGGCGKGQKSVPGLENFHAGVLQANLYVNFVATALHWDSGLSLPIPGLDGANLSVAPDIESGGTTFQFSIALASLLNHGQPLPISALPDGRDIPDIEGGQLPRWDLSVKDALTLSLYLSNDAFGLFVPLDFVSKKGLMLPWMVSVKISDEKGNLLGKAYAIPSKGGKGSGLFVLLPYLGGHAFAEAASPVPSPDPIPSPTPATTSTIPTVQ